MADMAQTEFTFDLPIGFLDETGASHVNGVMRLATSADEILPLRDPRVVENPAYKDVIILARVITRLGNLSTIGPEEIEGLYLRDLNYLRALYREINGLPPTHPVAPPVE